MIPESPLRRESPAAVGVDARVLDGPLLDLLAGSRTRAAALMVRGRLIWETYRDGCDAGTRFAVWSVTKAFTAAAVGLLVGDGKLALDDRACRFLPEWADDARRDITVRHLLTMTSGLALQYERFMSAPDATLAALRWPLMHRPGAVWCYEQATAHALAPIVARASGKQPLELLRERVLGPLGAGEISWDRTPGGDCLGHVGVNVSARDLCRFGELLLARGRHQGRALVNERFLARMLAVDPITLAARADPPANDARRRAYGFLLHVNAGGLWPGLPPDAFALLGAWGNMCLIDPLRDFVFVRLVTPAGRAVDPALDDNPLATADRGTARVFRVVRRAFDPPGSWLATRRRALRDAELDVRGELDAWARRRGLG